MPTIGIIPARYASTRFPGKPLAFIEGKTIIQHVYEQCKLANALDLVVVATDDERIASHVLNFGGDAVITSKDHINGTSRCIEALKICEQNNKNIFDIVINIQGDEPFIQPEMIDQVVSLFEDHGTRIATLAKEIEDEKEIFNPNVVKLLLDKHSRAMIFSRNALPYVRDEDQPNWYEKARFYKHIGLYGFRKDTLLEIAKLKPSLLEQAEKLEQLRWMENGYSISVALTVFDSFGIDTPEDLLKLTNKP